MNREEILKRNKESNPKDEGMEYIEDKAKRYGEIGLCIVFIILVIYKTIKGFAIYDLLALFWAYFGIGYIYKYRIFKTKKSLISAICGMIAAICSVLAYVLQTW